MNRKYPILQRYALFLPQLAVRACPQVTTDPISHFAFCTSIKSSCDYIRQKTSHLHRTQLNVVKSPNLRGHLSELLIVATSYPLVGMSRSVKGHRRPKDIFLTSLKQKLFPHLCLRIHY
jgi:hypothetical protein